MVEFGRIGEAIAREGKHTVLRMIYTQRHGRCRLCQRGRRGRVMDRDGSVKFEGTK